MESLNETIDFDDLTAMDSAIHWDWLEYEEYPTWQDVENACPECWRRAVRKLAESDLPNEFFLQWYYPLETLDPSLPQVDLRGKWHQAGIWYVLILRGFPCIENVKDCFLYHMEDPNAFGLGFVYRFVEEHSEEFADSFPRVLRKALYKFRDELFNPVFRLAIRCLPLSDEEKKIKVGGWRSSGKWQASVLENFSFVMKLCGIDDSEEQNKIRQKLENSYYEASRNGRQNGRI